MKPETSNPPSAPGFKARPAWIFAAVVVVAGAIWLLSPSAKQTAGTAFYEVKRADFLISIVEGGSLEAVSEISVRNEVEGVGRIIRIVPEGSYVKKGDLLVELDSSSAQDQVNKQLIDTEKASFAHIQAKETLAIQKSVVESEIRTAALKLEFAKADLRKYAEGEATQLKRNLEIEIANIQENLALGKERLEWSEKLQAKGFETKSNLDKDRLSVSQNTLKLEQSQKALWMFETFDFPKQKRQLESNVDEAGKELDRVKMQGDRKLAQYEAEVTTAQSTLDLSNKKLTRDQANLTACKIKAPQDGLVVYAMSQNRFSNESLIEEGATVRNRQEIIKLPDISEMKLSVRIHESHVNMVKPGQAAYIVLDSMPDQRYRGVVRKVALLPDSSSRFGNPNLKVYTTEILLTDALPNVKPGVSARAELVVTNLSNVLTVPLQAVTTRQGRQVAYVGGPDEVKAVPVEVGMYNNKLIQVLSGLKEGDKVLLAPPIDTQEKDLGGAILAKGEGASLTNPPALPPAKTNQMAEVRERGGDRDRGERPAADNAGEAGAAGAAGARPGRGPGGGGGGGFNREEMVKRFDKNGDGELDEEERTAMRAEFASRAGGAGGGPGGAGAPGGAPGGGGGGFNREEMVKRFDKNGDGELDEEERTAMRAEFGNRGGGQRRNRDGQGQGAPGGSGDAPRPRPAEEKGGAAPSGGN